MEDIGKQAAIGVDTQAKRDFTRPRRALLATDLISSGLAIVVASVIAYAKGGFSKASVVAALVTTLTALVTLGLLLRAGQYTSRRRIAALSDVGALTRCLLVGFAGTIMLGYVTKGFLTGYTEPSRLAVGSSLLTLLVLAVVSRIALEAYQRRLFAQGRDLHKVLVLGTGRTAAEFGDYLTARPWLGVVIAGQIAPANRSAFSANGSTPARRIDDIRQSPVVPLAPLAVLPTDAQGEQRLHELMRDSEATAVVIAVDPEDHAQLPRIAKLLANSNVPFSVVPSLFEQSYRAIELLGFSEIPVVDTSVDSLDRVARLFKRAVDVSVAACALVALLPVELFIMLAIAVESGFPVIFMQQRVGKNGRRFVIYKFRTMVADAESILEDLKHLDEGDGPHFKMANDPRLTKVGAFLRRWSLDELPQFLNVLLGDMSVVGPRPPLPQEVSKYQMEHLVRLRGKPGITGLWQISGRKNLTFDDMVNLDAYYLNHWSLRMDIAIMVRTLLAVVTRKGAY